MQTLEQLKKIVKDILKMRKKSRKRLSIFFGILAVVYFDTIKTRFDSVSRLLGIILKLVFHQIRVHKPKSKRVQYIVLLGVAFVTKYLTRLEVFPDDLDQLMSLPGRQSGGP